MARTVSIIAVICGVALFFMGRLLHLDWVGRCSSRSAS